LATETETVALHPSIKIDDAVAIGAVRSEVELKHRAQESGRAARLHHHCATDHLRRQYARKTRLNPIANPQLMRSFTRTSAWFQAKSDDCMLILLQVSTSIAPPDSNAKFDVIVHLVAEKVVSLSVKTAPPHEAEFDVIVQLVAAKVELSCVQTTPPA
jgi:hypothetical protein